MKKEREPEMEDSWEEDSVTISLSAFPSFPQRFIYIVDGLFLFAPANFLKTFPKK